MLTELFLHDIESFVACEIFQRVFLGLDGERDLVHSPP